MGCLHKMIGTQWLRKNTIKTTIDSVPLLNNVYKIKDSSDHMYLETIWVIYFEKNIYSIVRQCLMCTWVLKLLLKIPVLPNKGPLSFKKKVSLVFCQDCHSKLGWKPQLSPAGPFLSSLIYRCSWGVEEKWSDYSENWELKQACSKCYIKTSRLYTLKEQSPIIKTV